MPKCKNDPKATFTGNEPSPKGKGICAHAEKVGSTRTGTDRRRWVVATRGPKKQKYWKPAPAKKPVATKMVSRKPAAVRKSTKGGKKKSEKKPTKATSRKPAEPAKRPVLRGSRKVRDVPASHDPEHAAAIAALLEGSFFPGHSADLRDLGKWVAQIPSPESRKRLKKLLGPTRRKLEALGIMVVVVPDRYDADTGARWADWIGHVVSKEVERVHGTDLLDAQTLSIDLPMGQVGTADADKIVDNVIYMSHSLRPAMMKKAGEVIREAFPRRFEWNGRGSQKMLVRI